MADLKYGYTVDIENPTTSHSQAVLLVTPGSTVLDIGAADGSVARPLTARGCRVWCVERDPIAAGRARGACERLIVGDVEQMDLAAELAGQRFDYILFLDVLEHLRDPLAVLNCARDFLAPGGRVIASIPNVTHGAVRVRLMAGKFTYTETGLLDRTHLRFFDRAGAERLFADARLRIVERLRVSRGLTETEIPIDPSAVPSALLQHLRDDPDATTYQFVFAGIPADGPFGAMVADASLAERLQRRAEELEANYRELEAYTRALDGQAHSLKEQVERLTSRAADLETERSDVHRELERRMEELTQRHLELRHLQADLAVKEAFITELRQEREELARTREALEKLRTFVNSPGIQGVNSALRWLSRYPRVYGFLQWFVRRRT